MAWRRPGDKPLSEPMLVSLPTHICVTRSQRVNNDDNIFLTYAFRRIIYIQKIFSCPQHIRVVPNNLYSAAYNQSSHKSPVR